MADFGKGYSGPGRSRMVYFTKGFPDGALGAAPARPLGWSHFVEILPLANGLLRDGYAWKCRSERSSVRACGPGFTPWRRRSCREHRVSDLRAKIR